MFPTFVIIVEKLFFWCKLRFTPQLEKTMDRAGKADRPVVSVADPDKPSSVVSHTPSVSRPKENAPTELLTNEIIVDQGNSETWMAQCT